MVYLSSSGLLWINDLDFILVNESSIEPIFMLNSVELRYLVMTKTYAAHENSLVISFLRN